MVRTYHGLRPFHGLRPGFNGGRGYAREPRTDMYRRFLTTIVLYALAPAVAGADDEGSGWVLSDAEQAQLTQGEVIVTANVAGDRSAGDVWAAVEIEAPAEQVFSTISDCQQALEFVPHLRHCAVLESAPDGSWSIVEHRVDYGWYMPQASYVFRADYSPYTRISFTQVRGDFRENHGVWKFESVRGGVATVVTYRVHLVPRFYVPRWMMRATLKRDLPALMRGLRARSESQAQAAR